MVICKGGERRLSSSFKGETSAGVGVEPVDLSSRTMVSGRGKESWTSRKMWV